MFVGGRRDGLDLCDEDDLIALWREQKALDIVFETGERLIANDHLSLCVDIAELVVVPSR